MCLHSGRRRQRSALERSRVAFGDSRVSAEGRRSWRVGRARVYDLEGETWNLSRRRRRRHLRIYCAA